MAQWKMPVPPDYPLGEDVEISYQTTIYILSEDETAVLGDLYPLGMPYPAWTYIQYWQKGRPYYMKDCPVNVAWEGTNLDDVVDAFYDYDWDNAWGPLVTLKMAMCGKVRTSNWKMDPIGHIDTTLGFGC